MDEEMNISTDIDFDKNGKQISFLGLPYSPHTDAWGVIPIPMAVIKNGSGPTVLLMGGNHGDEYEGPITLGSLIRALDPAEIQGRLIIMPAANLPAVVAGRRVSSIDDGNLNRSFPGDPHGTPTSQIAHYIDSVLFPMADVFMDLHSGGSSLHLIPSAIMQAPRDGTLRQKILAAVLAFNAPLTVVMDTLDERRTAAASALRHGLVMVGAELGSAGAVSRQGLTICHDGVRNVLRHVGVLERSTETNGEQTPTRLTRVRGPNSYVYAPANGIYEAYDELGAAVESGREAGCVHFLDDPGRGPVAVEYAQSGMLFCRRAPGLVVRGNCVGVVVNDYSET
ncbi:MAG: succinylglutamate desuccinylase/aspartoacylase family protein [Gammaproteobacteria bacterium]|nr:succinylglutamate desuccinylase/aspartoacylase family protein [Gammaproteobacteria bacterium]